MASFRSLSPAQQAADNVQRQTRMTQDAGMRRPGGVQGIQNQGGKDSPGGGNIPDEPMQPRGNRPLSYGPGGPGGPQGFSGGYGGANPPGRVGQLQQAINQRVMPPPMLSMPPTPATTTEGNRMVPPYPPGGPVNDSAQSGATAPALLSLLGRGGPVPQSSNGLAPQDSNGLAPQGTNGPVGVAQGLSGMLSSVGPKPASGGLGNEPMTPPITPFGPGSYGPGGPGPQSISGGVAGSPYMGIQHIPPPSFPGGGPQPIGGIPTGPNPRLPLNPGGPNPQFPTNSGPQPLHPALGTM